MVETSGEEYEKQQKEEAMKKSNEDNDFPNKKRNQFIAGFVAMLAMAGYALSSGLIETKYIESSQVNNSEDYDDYED